MRAQQLLLGVLVASGCSDPGGTSTDARQSDARLPPTCEANGSSRAIVLSVNGDTDAIEVLGLDGGQLVNRGLRFTGVQNPDDVAIRSDGREALVSFGGFGQSYGVVVVELGEGGASASIRQTLELGADRRPFGVSYASDDRAVVTVAGGPSGHLLVGIERGGTGDFVKGMESPVPDDWPLGLHRRPGYEEVILLRSQLASDPSTDFYVLKRDGAGAWLPEGTPAMVADNPLDMAIAPDGNAIFAVTHDPADPVSTTNLDGGGLLHSVAVGTAGFGAATTVPLPGSGAQVAVDPGGQFVVADSPIFQVDPMTQTPISYTRRLITIARDGEAIGAVQAESEPWQALLLYGLEVAVSGHVVISKQLYPNQAPEEEATPIQVLLPMGDGNFTTCSTVYLFGQGRFAIAP